MSYRHPLDTMMQMRIGFFLVIGIGLFIAGVLFLGSSSDWFEDRVHLHAYFDDVTGLVAGSSVKIAGVNVGSVERISFSEIPSPKSTATEKEVVIDTGGNVIKPKGVRIRVDFKMDTAFLERVRADSVASVTTQGFLGDGFLFISVGSPKAEKLKDGDEVRFVRNPSGFTQLQIKAERIADQVAASLKQADTLLKNVNDVLDAVKTGPGLAHRLLYDKASGDLVPAARAMLNNLDKTTANLTSITGKIERGEGTIGKFVNDPQVFNDLKTLLGKANRNKLIRAVVRYTLQTRDASRSGGIK